MKKTDHQKIMEAIKQEKISRDTSLRILGLFKLKVKLKTLAAEARIIRNEEKKVVAYYNHPKSSLDYEMMNGSLHHHRVVYIRPIARAALLAYAFLRNRPYSSVEAGCKTPVSLQAVLKNVQTFGIDRNVSLNDIDLWVKAKPNQ